LAEIVFPFWRKTQAMRMPISVEANHPRVAHPTGTPELDALLFLVATLMPGVVVGLIDLVCAVGVVDTLRFLLYRQSFGDPLMVRTGVVTFSVAAVGTAILWLRLQVRVRVLYLPAPLTYTLFAGLFLASAWLRRL
jgi:hypothetical protein